VKAKSWHAGCAGSRIQTPPRVRAAYGLQPLSLASPCSNQDSNLKVSSSLGALLKHATLSVAVHHGRLACCPDAAPPQRKARRKQQTARRTSLVLKRRRFLARERCGLFSLAVEKASSANKVTGGGQDSAGSMFREQRRHVRVVDGAADVAGGVALREHERGGAVNRPHMPPPSSNILP